MCIIWQLIFCHPYVNLNFCLNRRTPSHITSMEGTREKTPMPLLELTLYLSSYFSEGPVHFFHLDG